MNYCGLRDACFFYNELVGDMPLATEHLRDAYCHGHSFNCTRFLLGLKYGMCKVPSYLFPDEAYSGPIFKVPTNVGHQGGNDMFINVVYPDGTSGRVRSSILGEMIQMGRIVAYKCSEGWVELRRKSHRDVYYGPERRVIIPFT